MTKKDVKDLAIAFEAYCEAQRDKRDLGICVWGRLLLKSQEVVGVELLEPRNIERMIKYAQKSSKTHKVTLCHKVRPSIVEKMEMYNVVVEQAR